MFQSQRNCYTAQTHLVGWSLPGKQLWRPVGKEWAVDRLPVLQAPNASALYCGGRWTEGRLQP